MGAHILVVDDEASIRDLFSEWLRVAGHTCVSAGNAAEALSVAEREKTDVALLDLRMPGESGVWLARRLRESRDDLAIIMATGAQSFDAAVEGMRLGVLDYLLKPFSRQELVDAVNRAVQWCEATARERAERERLEREIERRSAELSEAFAEVELTTAGALEALLAAFNMRNPDAFAHAKRVAESAVVLAQSMGVSASLLADIERGAMLHDIGKVAMPDSLIHKAGALSEEEVGIIRTHPKVGHDILMSVPFLRTAAGIVLASHEWLNGTGYPDGLKGDQIPLGARITSVADAFDALTCSRVYRDPVSVERANAELAQFSGRQFDPNVVRAWLRLSERRTATERN
ncbi:MAG TPA: HD domain-containing phosphohydrolase [Vicinamibacterales bacterium]|jgi:response regulator RpfG family c-di-GMP phosphodiesterase